MRTMRIVMLALGGLVLALALVAASGCKSSTASADLQKEFYPSGSSSKSITNLPKGEATDLSQRMADLQKKNEPQPKPEAKEKPAPKPRVIPPGKYKAPTDAEVAAAKKAGIQHAVIKTEEGDIEVELYGKDAPLSVANFVKLAKAGFYDGLVFHRIEHNPGFELIQGGDPAGNGSGGPGYEIKLELSPKLKHVEGALAMARSDNPDSAGSQFYICLVPISQLDGQYAVFGKVTKGLDNAKKIVKNDKIISIKMK